MLLSIHNPQSAIRNRRAGVTLMEVLLAIFVMGIGLLAILVLFPLGALNMAQAIKDDRLAHASSNAEAMAEMSRNFGGVTYSVRTDPQILATLQATLPNQNTFTPYLSPNPYYNTSIGNPPNPQTPWLFDPNREGPPVFIDPIGALLWPSPPAGGGIGRCVGTDLATMNQPLTVIYKTGVPVQSYGIRRCTTLFATTAPIARSMFSQEDEMTFDPNGQARTNGTPPSALVERWRKYSWAYMWRKPRFNEPKIADLTIVLFQSRAFEGASGLIGAPPEPPFLGLQSATDGRAFVQNSTTVHLKFDPSKFPTIPVKRGDWLLDATVILPNPFPPAYLPTDIPAHFNGYFYRVVGVGDVEFFPGTGEYFQTLEINRPALADGYVGVMITGVTEVIEKNDGRMPPN